MGAGDDLAVDGAGGDGGADGAAEGEDFGVDEEGVAGDDGFAEFDLIGAEEVSDFSDIVGEAHDEDGGGLGHGLELEDAGHDGVAGEVALEELLIHGEVLDRGTLHFGRESNDTVDEEEGVAVGEDFEDVLDVEDGLGLWEFDGWDHGAHGGVVFLEGFCGFGVGAVAGFDGDDVADKLTPGEHEVADEVEGFVAGKFVVEAHGLL